MGALKRKANTQIESNAQQVAAASIELSSRYKGVPGSRKRSKPSQQVDQNRSIQHMSPAGPYQSHHQAAVPSQANPDEPVWIFGLINNIEQMLTSLNAAQQAGQGATIGSSSRGSMPASPMSSAVPSPPGSSASSCSAGSPSSAGALSCVAPAPPLSSQHQSVSQAHTLPAQHPQGMPKSPISRQIKFHEYKGPPAVKRQQTSNSCQPQAPLPAASGKSAHVYLSPGAELACRTAGPGAQAASERPHKPQQQQQQQPLQQAGKARRATSRATLERQSGPALARPCTGARQLGSNTPNRRANISNSADPMRPRLPDMAKQGQLGPPATLWAPRETPSVGSASSLASPGSSAGHQMHDQVQGPGGPMEPQAGAPIGDEFDLAHVYPDLFGALDSMPAEHASEPLGNQHVAATNQPSFIQSTGRADDCAVALSHQVDGELLFSEFIDLQDVPMNVTESDWLKKFLPPCSLGSLTN